MSSERPNILLIIAHDLGTHLGCYGWDPVLSTPHLDRLSDHAVRTDQDGTFRMKPLKGGYLLLERPAAYQFTLVVRHSGYQTLTTNIDLLVQRPVKTNHVLTVFVGDLPLKPKGD